jgi:prephenate dehydrogenase
MKRIVIIGCGLIGGSMALDLRKRGFASEVLVCDKSPENTRKAIELGIADGAIQLSELKDNKPDFVIIAIPVNAINSLLPHLLDSIADHTVVLDTGSTKKDICEAVSNHPRRGRFVAAHPIAGTENSGPEAALRGLFNGKTCIVCEEEKSSAEALETALDVLAILGMNTVFMKPAHHDKHVAYVSHLSHVSSFLLAQTVLDIEKDEENIFNLAGSGFASTVRLAKSSPAMWAPIFEQNAEHLSAALLEYIMHLQRFQYHLMKRDQNALLNIMEKANHIRKVLAGIEKPISITHETTAIKN